MAFDLVFFGGTGDLVWRKLMPALFQAYRHGTLPEGGRIISILGWAYRHEPSDEPTRMQSFRVREYIHAGTAELKHGGHVVPNCSTARLFGLRTPGAVAADVLAGLVGEQQDHRTSPHELPHPLELGAVRRCLSADQPLLR